MKYKKVTIPLDDKNIKTLIRCFQVKIAEPKMNPHIKHYICGLAKRALKIKVFESQAANAIDVPYNPALYVCKDDSLVTYDNVLYSRTREKRIVVKESNAYGEKLFSFNKSSSLAEIDEYLLNVYGKEEYPIYI